MEHNLKTDVPNIHDKYHLALYNNFVFIEVNVKILNISRTKLFVYNAHRKNIK